MATPAGKTGLIYDTNLWLAFSFAIFVYIVWKAAGKLIIGALDKRSENIKKDILEAETLRTEAQQLLAQYQRKQRDAQKEAERMLDNAKTNAYQIRKAAEKDLKDSIALKEKQLAERITRMKDQAIAEIKTQAAHLSILATTHILAENTDKKTQTRLINDAIGDIKSMH